MQIKKLNEGETKLIFLPETNEELKKYVSDFNSRQFTAVAVGALAGLCVGISIGVLMVLSFWRG